MRLQCPREQTLLAHLLLELYSLKMPLILPSRDPVLAALTGVSRPFFHFPSFRSARPILALFAAFRKLLLSPTLFASLFDCLPLSACLCSDGMSSLVTVMRNPLPTTPLPLLVRTGLSGVALGLFFFPFLLFSLSLPLYGVTHCTKNRSLPFRHTSYTHRPGPSGGYFCDMPFPSFPVYLYSSGFCRSVMVRFRPRSYLALTSENALLQWRRLPLLLFSFRRNLLSSSDRRVLFSVIPLATYAFSPFLLFFFSSE